MFAQAGLTMGSYHMSAKYFLTPSSFFNAIGLDAVDLLAFCDNFGTGSLSCKRVTAFYECFCGGAEFNQIISDDPCQPVNKRNSPIGKSYVHLSFVISTKRHKM